MSRSHANEVYRRMVARIRARALVLGVQLTHVPDLAGVSRSHFWDVKAGRKNPTLGWLVKVATALQCEPADLLSGPILRPPPPLRESHRVPLVSLRATDGPFRGPDEVEPKGWVKVPPRRVVKPGMFAAAVSGRSMEPLIQDGSICLFRTLEQQAPDGKVVLVQFQGTTDPETGRQYTVKKIRIMRGQEGHLLRIRLEPANRKSRALVLTKDPMSQLTVVAQFLEVLVPGPG